MTSLFAGGCATPAVPMAIVKNEDYTLFDAVVHYDFEGDLDGVRLALNSRNLTDKRYINYLDGCCYSGEARNVVIRPSYSW